jgi:hypothetical protein
MQPDVVSITFAEAAAAIAAHRAEWERASRLLSSD